MFLQLEPGAPRGLGEQKDDRVGELLEGMFLTNEPLEVRDDAGERCLFLTRRFDLAEVVHGEQDLVLVLADGRCVEERNEGGDGTGGLEQVERRRVHRDVANTLEQEDQGLLWQRRQHAQHRLDHSRFGEVQFDHLVTLGKHVEDAGDLEDKSRRVVALLVQVHGDQGARQGLQKAELAEQTAEIILGTRLHKDERMKGQTTKKNHER